MLLWKIFDCRPVYITVEKEVKERNPKTILAVELAIRG